MAPQFHCGGGGGGNGFTPTVKSLHAESIFFDVKTKNARSLKRNQIAIFQSELLTENTLETGHSL